MIRPARKRDEVSDLEWLLLEFHRIEGCERTKARIMELIKAQAGKVIRFNFRTLRRPYQVERARQLLDAGNDRPTTRDRIMSEFRCSRSTAYLLIGEAMTLPKSDRYTSQARAAA